MACRCRGGRAFRSCHSRTRLPHSKRPQDGFSHSAEAFAQYLGHKTANSGPYKSKLAALRDWKLIARSSAPIVMTSLGQRVAVPKSDDDELAALREAFEACSVFQEVYDNSAKGVELDAETMANNAVHNQGISVARKSAFIRSFVDSAEVAGLLTRADGGKLVLGAPDSGSTPQEDPSEAAGWRTLARASAAGKQGPSAGMGGGRGHHNPVNRSQPPLASRSVRQHCLSRRLHRAIGRLPESRRGRWR